MYACDVVSCYMHLMNLCNNLSYLIYQSYLSDMNYIWSILYPCDTIVWTADNTILITAYICIKIAYIYLYENLLMPLYTIPGAPTRWSRGTMVLLAHHVVRQQNTLPLAT
jgi:hypothetical protein